MVRLLAMKTCTKCGEEKELHLFKKDSRLPSGYSSTCKKCAAFYSSKYFEKNRETILAKPIDKNWKSAHDKKYREKNKEKLRVKKQEYQKKNLNEFAARNALRRARKRQALPSWLTKEDKALIKAKYTMAKWLSLTCFQEYHVDHIVPLKSETVCGLHVPWNLQIISATDNLRKNNSVEHL
jgi:hypothetical protein